jgi:hypothetical protein
VPFSRSSSCADQFLGVRGEARGALFLLLLGLSKDAEVGPVQRSELPIHPAFDLGARRGVGRIQRRAAGRLVAEIAQDRIRFPDGQVAVDERRHLAARIQSEIRLGLCVVELPAVVLAL